MQTLEFGFYRSGVWKHAKAICANIGQRHMLTMSRWYWSDQSYRSIAIWKWMVCLVNFRRLSSSIVRVCVHAICRKSNKSLSKHFWCGDINVCAIAEFCLQLMGQLVVRLLLEISRLVDGTRALYKIRVWSHGMGLPWRNPSLLWWLIGHSNEIDFYAFDLLSEEPPVA